MEYSIIIPTYNHLDDCLKPCIESIKEYTDLYNVEIIVVANGCTDGTQDYLAQEKAISKVIISADPIGYTAATNIGIKEATGNNIILLNNDTQLLPQPKNQWLEILEMPMRQDNTVGIAGPLKLYNKEIGNDFIVFFCVMIRKEVIEKIGLLDEVFSPGYGEDTDYCLRCRSNGFKIIQVPDSDVVDFMDDGRISTCGSFPIYHKGHSSFGEISDIIKRNNSILMQRWVGMSRVNKEATIKLNLGCGDDIMDGWINIDAFAKKASVKANIKELPFPNDYADIILVSHVVEHFKFHEAFDAIKEWKRVLKPGGKLIIETPDLLETCREFVSGDEQWRIRLYGHFFAFPETPGQTHFFLYTETQLCWTLEQCGLRNINRIPPDSTYSRALPNKQNIFLRVECTK